MEPDPDEDRVNSKETFLAFVEQLRADWEASRETERNSPSSPYGPNARGWENPDLGRFLEAMQRWTEDMGDRVPEVDPIVKTNKTVFLERLAFASFPDCGWGPQRSAVERSETERSRGPHPPRSALRRSSLKCEP